ncbi:hypothetical protein Q2K19_10565 [Micromonospora soli]|uniref:hypothetical protein n=1 Tax=Micromonospora sp. NBRC 110009 TaxID=3061627 RepID=UPI002671291E|nr:hypothetical protein [Micromonospora sp. NBRC 110009]WKU00880.1 hypothetical protein Q2K19_10565 [Micromonospora sp. NBRC 110009]
MATAEGSSSTEAATTRPDDALAALRDGRRYPRPADRPRRLRLDSGLTLELPAPRILARVWALPTLAAAADVYASRAAILRRPHGATADPRPVDFRRLVDELRAELAALPEREDAGRPYSDLRIYVRHGDPSQVVGYLLDVVKAARVVAPRWRPPAVRKERTGPPPTATERQRIARYRRKAREVESAEHWLRLWLADATPGRYDARELHAQAVDALGEFVEWYEDDPDGWAEEAADDGSPAVPVVPGVKAFYAVADRLLGPRSRTAAGYAYAVPEPAVVAEVADRVARLAWADQRVILARFLARQHAPTAERNAAA